MNLFKGKSKRTRIFGVITLLVIVFLFGINLFLSILGLNKSIYIDLTPEGLYTLSDEMVAECSFVNELDGDGRKIKIIFCNDPDKLISSTTTRVTYFMALKLEKMFDNIEVEAINVNFNPTAVSKYKTTSLSQITTADVIVAYGDRYRIVGAENFWTKSSSTGQYWSYNGEYRLATLMKSVTLANDSNPTAYFLVGHGETYYDADNKESAGSIETEYFKDLLIERGLKVKLLNISEVDAIPSDCALLIMNKPTEDYVADPDRYDEFFYVSDLEKIDRYLTKNQGAMMVALDPFSDSDLSTLKSYLYEWGFEFSDSVLRDKEGSAIDDTAIKAVYNTNPESYGNAIYGEFAALASAPKMLFKNSGYVKCAYGISSTVNEAGAANIVKRYASFLTTPNTAIPYAYNELSGKYDSPSGNAGAYDLAGVTTRTAFDSKTAEYTYSYVFCASSANFFSGEMLSNASYSNFDIISALVNNMSRMDIYASSSVGGVSMNNADRYGGKRLVSTLLSTVDTYVYGTNPETGITEIEKTNKAFTSNARKVITVCVFIIPTLTLCAGIFVSIKRKFK